MAMIAFVSAKGSPGATSTVAALASSWPAPLLVVDADPAGGDLAPGWLSAWLPSGHVRLDRGVVSFTAATRRFARVTAAELTPHLQQVPDLDSVKVLVGLTDPAQNVVIGRDGWQRLAQAVTGAGVDVLVDVGRLGPDTPWSLLQGAQLVLLSVRSTQRSVLAGRVALSALATQVDQSLLGLSVSASTPSRADEVGRALGMTVGVRLPVDPVGATVFSDGSEPRAGKRPLAQVAAREAIRLQASLNRPAPRSPLQLALHRAGAGR
ncbi:hypothetical protein D5S17_14740 [Pseudonocardiaceae bacterium YIM PH 21723]|nr:hypothetical protein D5S17_14740 [Pseudonocardiaceae bacterium YIM PH 21723]